MLKTMVVMQWTRVRILTVLTAVVALAVPIVMVSQGGGPSDGYAVGYWLGQAELVGTVLPIASLFVGLYLGVATWMDDARGRHVYALTLPVRREKYVVYRFVAGALPALVPVGALLAGSLIATAIVTLPPGIQAYPFALAGRALLASLTMYAIFFALASATKKAAAIVLGSLAGLLIAQLIVALLGFDANFTVAVGETLTRYPAPFAILMGRWALFDV